MSDKPRHPGPDDPLGDDDLAQPPRPEQIWPPPGPQPEPPAEFSAPADEDDLGDAIDLDWDEGVEKIDDVIEEIRQINGETPAKPKPRPRPVPLADAEPAPAVAEAYTPRGPAGRIEASVRARSSEELAQLWSNVFFSTEKPAPRIVVVTTARRGDGASQVSAGLAMIGAAANRDVRIALIDLNLRSPRLASLLGASGEPGVTDVLSGRTTLDAAVQTQSLADGGTLYFLPAGEPSEQPLGLFKSRQFKSMMARLGDRFDHVIIDSASAGSHPDAQVVGSMSDGALLVVRAGQTPRETVAEVKKRLDLAGTRLLGLVLNQRSDPIPSLLYNMT